MQIQEMKKGLFGYKKESVYRYVSSLNEEFSQKLIAKDEKNELLIQELRDRAQTLETELAQMRKECDDLRKKQLAVSDSIVDAQEYAAQLKSETALKERALCNQLEKRMEKENIRLDDYAANISLLRDQLKQLLAHFDEELKLAGEHAAELKSDALATDEAREGASSDGDDAAREDAVAASVQVLPKQNMGLFERRKV